MKRDFLLECLGVEAPVFMGAMDGGVCTPELVAAVANAGGLGTLTASQFSPEMLRQQIKRVKELTDKPFAVHLKAPQPYQYSDDQVNIVKQCVMPFARELGINELELPDTLQPSFSEQMAVILDEKIKVFSFSGGIPALKWFDQLRDAYVVVLGTATSLEEAQILEKVGVDAIIAQGSEASGERSNFLSDNFSAMTTRDTLCEIIAEAVQLPLISAGGLVTAEQVEQALEIADAVQLSSVFLNSDESALPAVLKEKLINMTDEKTVLTTVYTGRLARVLDNRFVAALSAYKTFMLPPPVQAALLRPVLEAALRQQCYDILPLYVSEGFQISSKVAVADLVCNLYRVAEVA